jgi:hypothetical protein
MVQRRGAEDPPGPSPGKALAWQAGCIPDGCAEDDTGDLVDPVRHHSVGRNLLLGHESDGPTPSRAGSLNLDGQTGDVEAVGPRDLIEVRQLLDLAVFAFDACEVRGPDVAAIDRPLVVGHHVGERPVQGVAVDADDLHALLDQPEDALSTQPGLSEVAGRAEALVGAGVQEHDVERLELVADLGERGFKISDRDELAGLLVPDIKQHTRREAPLQRYMVDGSGSRSSVVIARNASSSL